MKENELKHWKQISFAYITEESDDAEDPLVIVEHKLSWRSQRKSNTHSDVLS